MKEIYYHVVTEKPMHLNQEIIFNNTTHSSLYERVETLKEKVNEIYSNPDKYKNEQLDHHTRVALRELALEKIRISKYPNYPSRLNSLYVSKTLEEAQMWYDYFIKLGRKIYQIVKIEFIGKSFTGNAYKCFDGTIDESENLKLAELYWKNNCEDKTINETIISGKIKVVEIIKENNISL